MDMQYTKNVIEAALMCAGEPLDVNEILRLFDEGQRPDRKTLLEALESLGEDYQDRAIELRQVASGYRIQVRSDFAELLGRLDGKRAPKYSRALLETLVLVAYRQPVTRGEIESVRGVSVSSNIIRTLLERGWVRIVGHRDVPGRPAMLGTTKGFLDYFGLTSLDDLPSLSELKDFDSINVELEFDAPPDTAPASGEDADAAAADVQVQQEHDADIADIMDDDEVAPDDVRLEDLEADSLADDSPADEQDSSTDVESAHLRAQSDAQTVGPHDDITSEVGVEGEPGPADTAAIEDEPSDADSEHRSAGSAAAE